MGSNEILTEEQLKEGLSKLPQWEVRDGWLRRTYKTPGWEHTMMLVQTIGYIAEAADHHPDLSVGYAQVTVKVQTHRVNALTAHDVELAQKIDEVVLWQPTKEQALGGFPKQWVH